MSLSDIENMIIWERDIYISMLNGKAEKQRMAKEEKQKLDFMAGAYR